MHYDDMLQLNEIHIKTKQLGNFSYLGCYKTPPLKESRPEIPTEKGKGPDTSREDPLRSPMLPLYRNDEPTAL